MSKLFLLIFIIFYSVFIFPKESLADNCTLSTKPSRIIIPSGKDSLPKGYIIEYEIKVNDSGNYKVTLQDFLLRFEGWDNVTQNSSGFLTQKDGKWLIKTIGINDSSLAIYKQGRHQIKVERKEVSGTYCTPSYTIYKEEESKQVVCIISQTPSTPNGSSEIKYSGSVLPADGQYRFWLPDIKKSSEQFTPDSAGVISEQSLGFFNPGTYQVRLQKYIPGFISQTGTTGTIEYFWKDTNCIIKNLVISSTNQNPNPNLTPAQVGSGGAQGPINCLQNDSCTSAAGIPCNPEGGGSGTGGIMTAIGCIPTEPTVLIQSLLQFFIGIGGGIALLLMIYGAFLMIISAGNPEGVKRGQEQFYSAIIGLLFIIFSILLLQIIGVDILNIPGFTK
ncbi:pilin [Patescibacteria group bacterium]|nr:pilin [Patescibacteria group bacterium]